MSRIILKVLGSAQDAGLPHPNCFCKNCMNAIEYPEKRRTASSLAVVLPEEKQWYLIDASPDLKEQMWKLQLEFEMKKVLMSGIFLTHAHLGHFPGLLFLGKEAMNTDQIPVMAGPKMAELLSTQATWKQLVDLKNINLQILENLTPVNLTSNLKITPVLVPHRNEFSETFGFWIEGNSKKVLYIPDIDRWEQWDIDVVEAVKEADICIFDGTFHSIEDIEKIGRDYRQIPHPLMTDTMDRLQELVDQTDIYFIHLNHSNPALDEDQIVRQSIESRGFHVADDFMNFDI